MPPQPARTAAPHAEPIIRQVHAARLVSGERVVLKVQHPEVATLMV